MSSAIWLRNIEAIGLGEVKPKEDGRYYRTLHIGRLHPQHGDVGPLQDVDEITMCADEPQKLVTENEKQLIRLIKAMLAAMESSIMSGNSALLQELRKAVEKIEGGQIEVKR
jgi:hypothetical protein